MIIGHKYFPHFFFFGGGVLPAPSVPVSYAYARGGSRYFRYEPNEKSPKWIR